MHFFVVVTTLAAGEHLFRTIDSTSIETFCLRCSKFNHLICVNCHVLKSATNFHPFSDDIFTHQVIVLSLKPDILHP